MIDIKNKNLAINGGTPITKEPVIIHKPYMDESDFKTVYEITKTTFISGDGPACREFEQKLAEYLGVKHVLFMNSATSALDVAFRVKDFPAGSEVLVPNFTYTSTALGALYNNLKVRLVDVHPYNGNIDPSKIESLINNKTVAIAPVDYAGNPAQMDEINAIAKKHSLYVVHDTAQSVGALYKGIKTGSQADVSTFSFHGTKNLTTGEGGAFVTNNDEIAARAKIIREKGTDKYNFISNNISRGFYEYVDIGNSYVQSNILGALGVSQLKKIDEITQKRKEIANHYLNELKDIPGLDLPATTNDCESNWHLFYLLIPRGEDKYWVMDALRDEGIMANIHYSPLHRNKYYSDLGSDNEFSGSMEFFDRLIRIPIYPSLAIEERNKVIKAVKKVLS